MKRTFLLGLGIYLTTWGLAAATDTPKLPAPAPTKADEPLADKLSFARAAEFLDAASLNWTQQRKCGSCHTNYPYLLARPLLKEADGPAQAEVRRFFEDRAAHWETAKPRWDTEVVATASALAFHDAQTTGKLHPLTRKALDAMWPLQQADGSWKWLKCNWPPFEADDYYGVLTAALGVAVAPDGYAATDQAREGLARIKKYLEATKPPSLHHQAWRLWVATKLPDLMPADQRQATAEQLLAAQRPDGGWSLPGLGAWKRHNGAANEAGDSDGYATGLVVYVLRQTGLPADHPAVARGVTWLRTHQRQSGRWFTRSLSNDRDHYITHAGSAFAVLALKACDVKE